MIHAFTSFVLANAIFVSVWIAHSIIRDAAVRPFRGSVDTWHALAVAIAWGAYHFLSGLS